MIAWFASFALAATLAAWMRSQDYGWLASLGAAAVALQHDPEKWVPVFGKDHAPTIR
jgi:hypothetical protein